MIRRPLCILAAITAAHTHAQSLYDTRPVGIPEDIRSRPPTTDTYSLPQSQDEFYFSLPHHLMDLCLYGKNNDVPIEQVAAAADLTVEQVERVYADIDQKRRSTKYLHLAPVLMDNVTEI